MHALPTQEHSRGEILIVEDTPASLKLLSDLLTEAGYYVRQAPNGELALWTAASRPPELILLDVRMPGIDGFEVCRSLKQSEALRDIPVIFLSAQYDTDDKVRGFGLGAVDFIAKPFQAEEILARTDTHVRLARAQRQLAQERTNLEERVRERTAQLAVSVGERTAERRLIDQLQWHDALTGLPNRALARERFDACLAGCLEGQQVAVLCLDLDRFKSVNDALGHQSGDRALQAVANFLCAQVREGDTVSRQGGDEFQIILRDDAGLEQTALTARRILAGLRDSLYVDGQQLPLTTSIGIAVSPSDGASLDELVRNADTALVRAKETGRDGYSFFTERMNVDIRQRMAIQQQLRGAIARDEFTVYYQPQMCLTNGHMLGAEALLRWDNAVLGRVGPDRFIPLAEEFGLIRDIGAWVLESVAAQIADWRRMGHLDIKVAVNLSGRQFEEEGTVDFVEQVLRRHALPASCLGLEITEGTVMGDPDKAVATLSRLKAIGVAISLDDFGTGYSSLGYLKRFPIGTLKIDKSFIDDVTTSVADAAIALSVISLGHNLGMKVVAEGVETRAQRDFLREHGCDEMQGYFFSRPVPAADMTALLGTRKNLYADDAA